MTSIGTMHSSSSSTAHFPDTSDTVPLNVAVVAVSSTSINTPNDTIASAEEVETVSKQDKIPPLDRAIILQKSEKSSDFTAFVNLLPSLVKTCLSELLSAAKQFNPNATGALIRELYKQKECDLELLSFYWDNYTTDLPYAVSLRRWTLTHASFPPSIVKHLDTFDKKTISFVRLCDAIWFQINLFPEDAKLSFFAYYWKFLIESNRFSEAKCTLLEAKTFLTPQEFADYFKQLDGKKTIKKSLHWVAFFKQEFHKALDVNQYEASAYALMQIKRFLREGDGGLYFPALALTFLKALQQEENKALREDALLQFDRLFALEEMMSFWAAQPPLFTEGVVVYLQMTNISVESGIIKVMCSLQSNLSYPDRAKWTLPLFKYLSRQSHWPQASLLYIKSCFAKNLNFLSSHFSKNEDPELLLNLSVLCLKNKIDEDFLRKCFEDRYKSTLIQSFPEKTSVLIELYIEKNGLQDSSKIEPVLKMIVLLGKSKEWFSRIKPALDILLKIEKNVLQKNLSMAKGYVDLFDILLESDSSLCMDLLKKLDRIDIDNLTKCYEKYLEKLLKAGKLEDSINFCDKFAHYVGRQEIIPYIQKEQLSTLSSSLREFILTYRISFSPELWIRFSLHLHKTTHSNIVIDYFQHTLDCLKKMSTKNSQELDEQELSEVIALLRYCGDKILDKKMQQELCLFVPEYIVKYPLTNKEDQIKLLNDYQGFALKQTEKKFIESFRKHAEKLSKYNESHKNSPVLASLYPVYNDVQEIKKMSSLPLLEELQPLLSRANYYLGRIKESKLKEAHLAAAEALSKLISLILTKNIEKRSAEFQQIFKALALMDNELHAKLEYQKWLETVFSCSNKSTNVFLPIILNLALKHILREDIYRIVSEKLSEYIQRQKVILDDSIRALLNTNFFLKKEKIDLFHQILEEGCKYIKAEKVHLNNTDVFVRVEDDLSRQCLEQSFAAITEYMHLLDQPEKFLPQLKHIYEGIVFIFTEKKKKAEKELKKAAECRENFFKKWQEIDLNGSVKFEIVKDLIYAFARHLNVIINSKDDNYDFFKKVYKSLYIDNLTQLQYNELMEHEYRWSCQETLDMISSDRIGKLSEDKYDLLKSYTAGLILSETESLSDAIISQIEQKKINNLHMYVNYFNMRLMGNLGKVEGECLNDYVNIIRKLLRKLSPVEYEHIDSFKLLDAAIKDLYLQLFKMTTTARVYLNLAVKNGWNDDDKESFMILLFEIMETTPVVSYGFNAITTSDYSIFDSYLQNIYRMMDFKGIVEETNDEDLGKKLEKTPIVANFFRRCFKWLEVMSREKNNNAEWLVSITRNFFKSITDSNIYQQVCKREEREILEVLDKYVNDTYFSDFTYMKVFFLNNMESFTDYASDTDRITYIYSSLETLYLAWKDKGWDEVYEGLFFKLYKQLLQSVKAAGKTNEKSIEEYFDRMVEVAMAFALTPLNNGLDLSWKMIQCFETEFSDDANTLTKFRDMVSRIPQEGYYKINVEFENACNALSQGVIKLLNNKPTALPEINTAMNSILNPNRPIILHEIPGYVLNICRVLKQIMEIDGNERREVIFFGKNFFKLMDKAIALTNMAYIGSIGLEKDAEHSFFTDNLEMVVEFLSYCKQYDVTTWNMYNDQTSFVAIKFGIFTLKHALRQRVDLLTDKSDETVKEKLKNEKLYSEIFSFIKTVYKSNLGPNIDVLAIGFLNDLYLLMKTCSKHPEENKLILQEKEEFSIIYAEWLKELSTGDFSDVQQTYLDAIAPFCTLWGNVQMVASL